MTLSTLHRKRPAQTHPLLGTAFLIATAIVPAACTRAPRTPPQHVVLLVVDTLRADHLSCYGYARPTSPAIDALAAQGVRFANAVSQSSWTSPSMVSMMTSRYIAAETLSIPDERPTLAEQFQRAGFATAAFITNDILNPENRFERGFDVFEWQMLPYGPNQPILDWFGAHKDARTFTFIHLAEPHDEQQDYLPPESFHRWRNVKEGFSPERLRYYGEVSAKLKLVDESASLAHIESGTGAYDDDVACVDARIGEILDAIQKLGLWERTAVVLASDHGEGLWAYEQFPIGTRKKAQEDGHPPTLANTMHQTHGAHVRWELVHVPLILKAPGIEPAVFESFVENVDIAPTLLELAALPPIPDAHGTSLVPFAEDPDCSDGLKPGAFTYTMYNSSLITQAGLQMVLPTPLAECEFGTQPEFYDVLRDPESRVDLFAKHRDRQSALQKIVDERLHAGLSVPGRPGEQTLEALKGLGYIAGGMIDVVREDLERLSTNELIAKAGFDTNCLLRLEAIRALRDRDLSVEQRDALRAAGEHGGSRVVREAISALLR